MLPGPFDQGNTDGTLRRVRAEQGWGVVGAATGTAVGQSRRGCRWQLHEGGPGDGGRQMSLELKIAKPSQPTHPQPFNHPSCLQRDQHAPTARTRVELRFQYSTSYQFDRYAFKLFEQSNLKSHPLALRLGSSRKTRP